MQTSLRAALRQRTAFGLTRGSPFTPTKQQFIRTLVTKKYTVEHEAVSFNDTTGLGTVYITNYAQKSLGDVVFVELPKPGTEVSLGDQIGAVESVKAASDIYAPVSGIIEEINNELETQPGLLNKSPEDQGWLCKIKLSNTSEMEELLSEDAYKKSYES
ncbi:Glycine cleavage H domain containing protein [Amanita muscaria]|uniref:Glycine cleavage system H protein n=1 Tax=Amanita muscaria (strain Koide BX008) TaxID=946122 RepID=A0A0C2XMG4_AMAMK|nr:hypothetical protein M378DRAFT_183352 [Amanita muscaria Koide BX008]